MKTIAFVRSSPSLRIYNQALALKHSNKYKSILICKMMDKDSLRLFSKVFDEIMFYQPSDIRSRLTPIIRKSPLMYQIGERFLFLYTPLERFTEGVKVAPFIKRIDADAFNCVIRPYRLVRQVIKNSKAPIILDAYDFDGIMHGIENLAKVVYKREKYCFEHASGVIHRGPEFEIDYYRSHSYKITCPTLSFLDYCNKEFFVDKNVKKLSAEDGEYHLVHIGSGISYQFVTWLKEAVKQKIHFHLYTTPTGITSKAFKEIVNLNNKTSYVHFEKTVPFDKINQEIAKYDFGTFITLSSMRTYKTEIGLKVLHCHRIFNYLEVGVPVIVTDCLELVKKTVVENKIGFSLKDDEVGKLRSMIEKYDYDELRKNVFRARKKLLIDNHAKRLVEFHDGIIEGAEK